MSLKKKERGTVSVWPLIKVMIGFGSVGAILFLHVWLPVQAERSLFILRRLEGEISQKKSELNALNERYGRLTSLAVLDRWARNNGPWDHHNTSNVIAIEK